MLEAVHLKNYLFFEQLTIELGAGLNIFTGETGAGKSILVNAIKIACGVRIANNLHLDRTKPMVVSLSFANVGQDLFKFLEDNDIVMDLNDENGANELIIRRNISINNSSKYFVNDVPCTQKFVRQISEFLVEFTSQNSTLKLCNPKYQRYVLDSLLDVDVLESLRNAYQQYNSSNKQLNQLYKNQQQALEQEDYLKFVAHELQTLNMVEDEENKLLENIAILKKHRVCIENIGKIDVEIDSMRKSLHSTLKHVQLLEISENTATKHHELLDGIGANLEEFESEHRNFVDRVMQAQESYRLDELEDRLYLLREHSRKYRVPVHELPNFLLDVQDKLDNLSNSKQSIQMHEEQCAKDKKRYFELSRNVHELRIQAAKLLEQNINQSLAELNMRSALVRIGVIENLEQYSEHGYDNVVFEARTNVGKNFEILSNIASGGELSRIMLSIKSNLKLGSQLLYIFDEIDTGISGSTSSLVGKKLQKIGEGNQLIVITHQPQVAVFADRHFKVCKSSNDNNTQITFLNINGQAKILEIARMLSGEKISDASVDAAKSLISQI